MTRIRRPLFWTLGSLFVAIAALGVISTPSRGQPAACVWIASPSQRGDAHVVASLSDTNAYAVSSSALSLSDGISHWNGQRCSPVSEGARGPRRALRPNLLDPARGRTLIS
jgi:hypothetical protein